MMDLDWKDDAQYKYLESLNNHQWAFEFLRRNEKYQDDYLEYNEKITQLTDKYGPYTEKNKDEWYKDVDYWHYEPPRLEGENNQEWLHRTLLLGKEPQRFILERFLAKKWGLVGRIYSPSQIADTSILFELTGDFPKLPVFEQVTKFFEDDIYGPEDKAPDSYAGPSEQRFDFAVVVFSFHHDLDKQIKAATAMVKEKLSQAKKDDKIDVLPKAQTPSQKDISATDYLRRLLRVLDAIQLKCSQKDIAKVLFPEKPTYNEGEAQGEKQISRDYKKARELSQRKYRSIPLFKSLSSY